MVAVRTGCENRTRKSFPCHTSKKRVCKSFACHTFSNLKSPVPLWSEISLEMPPPPARKCFLLIHLRILVSAKNTNQPLFSMLRTLGGKTWGGGYTTTRIWPGGAAERGRAFNFKLSTVGFFSLLLQFLNAL